MKVGCTFLALVACFALTPVAGAAEPDPSTYVIRSDRWSDEDEAGYSRFIQAIGESECNSLNACLHSAENPFRDSDPPDHVFESDCADLPYVLRFYYAWKRGLPFSYVSEVTPAAGGTNDIRYTQRGNRVSARTDVRSGSESGYRIIERLRHAISSATYRVHPDLDSPLAPDFYSPAVDPKSIRPGTMVYDAAGHVAIVFRVDPDGRVHAFDAHTDFSLTELVFDVRFARVAPSQGAGFKNWRPIRLVGAKTMPDGSLRGGHVEVARNAALADFSDEQYYGTGARPTDATWAAGTFSVNGEALDYYDFVRARLAGGKLVFDPVKEVRDMGWSLCSDLQYRAAAVQLASDAGISRQPHPARLPRNIYGTEGDWEVLSTPSRDARLKTAFKAWRDSVQRFVEMDRRKDTIHLAYTGHDLPGDLLKVYGRVAQYCKIQYRRSDGSTAQLGFEEVRRRLFALSFDPYDCPERRWGATGAELSTCPDDALKTQWYEAERNLRNQIERTYDARMDFSLDDLQTRGAAIGVANPPDTDVHGYLIGVAMPAEN